MSDNLNDRGPRDRSRIDINEEWECRYWSRKFGITPDDLKDIVLQVGDRVEAVENKLGWKVSA